MRTPLELARTLGWPEARPAAEVGVNLLGPMPAHRMRRIVARMNRPYLTVHRSKSLRRDGTARWLWEVRHGGEIIDYGDGVNWAVALHVGLAALDTHSVRSTL